MDLSEKYQRMCEGAGEIQLQWQPEIGDWGYDVSYGIGPVVHEDEEYSVWLPRQDQLQAMIEYNEDVLWAWQRIRTWWTILPDLIKARYVAHIDTDEQLWLAFVMHEKYGKVWDDNEGVWKVVHEQEV